MIAIIAILAAILFPVFAQAKLAAKKTVSISNVKQIGLSTNLYLGDYDDMTVPLRWFSVTDGKMAEYPTSQGFFFYPVLLQPYSKNTQMFYCPMDTADDPTLADSKGRGRFDKSSELFWYSFGAYPSFGMNWFYLNDSPTPAPGRTRSYYGKSATGFEQPAQTVLFAEASGKDIVSPGRPVVTNPVGYHRIDPPSRWDRSVRYPNARAQGQLWGRFDHHKVLTVWLDGHANMTPLDKLKGTGTTPEETDRLWSGVGN